MRLRAQAHTKVAECWRKTHCTLTGYSQLEEQEENWIINNKNVYTHEINPIEWKRDLILQASRVCERDEGGDAGVGIVCVYIENKIKICTQVWAFIMCMHNGELKLHYTLTKTHTDTHTLKQFMILHFGSRSFINNA